MKLNEKLVRTWNFVA